MESFNYTISIKKNINEDERKALLNLYQPILGVKATSIYLTLLEEKEVLNKLNHLVFNEKRLMKLLKLSNPKLMEGIHKLEGIKLLKRSYQKNKDRINFQILPPLETSAFFENVILNEMLKKSLGEQDYEVLRYCYFYEEILDEEVEDLTFSFAQAFPEENSEITLKNLSLNPEQEFLIEPKHIDFSGLELELIQAELPTTILTAKVKKILLENINFFNLNQNMMVEALIHSYDEVKEETNCNLLKIYLKNEIAKQAENQKNYQFEQMKNEFKQMEPEDYLESWGVKLTLTSKRLLDVLKNKYHLAKENINCLLNYSALKNKGKIVDNYIIKIASTLEKQHITNLDDVMDHLKTAHVYVNSKTETSDLAQDDVRFANINNDLIASQTDNVDIDLPEPNKYFMI